jgi:hypothetical protein
VAVSSDPGDLTTACPQTGLRRSADRFAITDDEHVLGNNCLFRTEPKRRFGCKQVLK